MEHSQGVNGDIIKMHMQNTSTRLIIRHEDEWSIHKVFAGDIIKCICTTQVHTLKQAYTLGTCIPTSTKEISTHTARHASPYQANQHTRTKAPSPLPCPKKIAHTQQGTFLPTKQISIHAHKGSFSLPCPRKLAHTHSKARFSLPSKSAYTHKGSFSLPCPRKLTHTHTQQGTFLPAKQISTHAHKGNFLPYLVQGAGVHALGQLIQIDRVDELPLQLRSLLTEVEVTRLLIFVLCVFARRVHVCKRFDSKRQYVVCKSKR